MNRIFVIAAGSLALVSCGGGKDSGSGAGVTASAKTEVKGQAVPQLNLAQKTDAATPKGFKATTSLAPFDATATCTQTYGGSGDNRPDGFYACMAAYAIRQEFFQSGPTVIKTRLENVETRLNQYIGDLSSFEIPCFDPNHTSTRTAEVSDGQTKVSEAIPPYALTTFTDKTALSDGHTFDLGRSFYFSCANEFESNNYKIKILIGQKDKSWYLGESTSSTGSEGGSIKTLMSLDGDDNMEIFLGIGSLGLLQSTATNPETGTASSVKSSIYTSSTGFAQFVIRPTEGIIGAASLFDSSCERRMVMNDVAVYVEVNGNNYGRCFASDNWINDSTKLGPVYSATKSTLKACLKVSGTLPEPQTDLTLCESSGLLVAKEDGTYEDPFARYGILKLGSNLSSPPSGGYALRAYHGGRLWPDFGKNVNKLQRVVIPVDSEIVIDGIVPLSMAFNKASDGTNSDSTSVSATCDAAASAREKTVTQKWEFKTETFLNALDETIPAEIKETFEDAERRKSALLQINDSLARTGDQAPFVITRMTRSLGANYRAAGVGTYTLKYDGAVVGTAAVDQTTLANDKGQSDVKISFSTIPTVIETGTFSLEFTGKTVLSCNIPTTATRKGNIQLGLATLKIFSKAEDPDKL